MDDESFPGDSGLSGRRIAGKSEGPRSAENPRAMIDECRVKLSTIHSVGVG